LHLVGYKNTHLAMHDSMNVKKNYVLAFSSKQHGNLPKCQFIKAFGSLKFDFLIDNQPSSYSGYSSSSETNTSLARQKTPRTSWNPKFTTVLTTARQLSLS